MNTKKDGTLGTPRVPLPIATKSRDHTVDKKTVFIMKKLILPLRNRVKQLEYPFKLMLTQKIEATQNRFTSWRHENDLFFSIITWVLVATVAYTLLNWFWGDRGIFSGWSLEENTSTPLERIKVSLTILGGTGGIGYLVIKFRERSALERSEADEKLVRAVQQLGDASPQVRIAGVYALADVADTYEGPYHQRVVDILCGYLRTDRLLKDANGETRYATNKDGFLNYDHPLSSDGPVESAILSIIASHLRPPQTTSKNKRNKTDLGPWSSYRIDLHNAILTEQIYFVNCHFKQLDLRRATLFDRVIFSGSHFFEAASFESSIFKQVVDFGQAHFDFHSSFQGAEFKKDALFDNAEFNSTSNFSEVTFAGNSRFYGTIFSSICEFSDSTFIQDTCFKEAEFNLAYFRKCTFRQSADFTPNKIETLKRTWVLDSDGSLLDGNLEPTFFEADFNIKLRGAGKIIFPEYRRPSASRAGPSKVDGLPEGARWVDFETSEYHSLPQEQQGEGSPNEEDQPDEIPPTDNLSQDEGGEEDGDE